MPTAVGPNTFGEENLVFGYDLGDTINSYKGEPTTNIVPSPADNGRFTTSNGWATYNTNQYNGNTYFSIGTVSSITDNIVTLSSVGRTIRSFDVLTPQTTGGGVTAGTRYVIKKLSSTTFSLHEYNSSQNGSEGYINPDTGFYKVHDAYANDTRISINATDFPTMWWGPPHLPNSGLIKEIVEGGGRVRGTNAMRLHLYRGDGVSDGMAYGVYCPVTAGDIITVSYYQRAATPSAVGKSVHYSTYFGSGNGAYGLSATIGEFMEWKKVVHQWTASATFSFYSYFFPDAVNVPYSVDLADFQVEINKGHATPFTAGTRSATQGLLDLTGNSTIDLSNASFDSSAQKVFDGTDDYIGVADVGISDYSQPFTMECIFMVDPAATWDNGYRSNIFGIAGSYSGMYGLNKHGGDSIGLYIRDSSGGSGCDVGGLSKGVYYHLVGTWDGTDSIRIYLNGTLRNTTTSAKSGSPDTTNIWLGGRRAYSGANGNHYQGELPVAKYYNRALTASEIKSNYNAIKGRFNI